MRLASCVWFWIGQLRNGIDTKELNHTNGTSVKESGMNVSPREKSCNKHLTNYHQQKPITRVALQPTKPGNRDSNYSSIDQLLSSSYFHLSTLQNLWQTLCLLMCQKICTSEFWWYIWGNSNCLCSGLHIYANIIWTKCGHKRRGPLELSHIRILPDEIILDSFNRWVRNSSLLRGAK